MKIDTVKLAHVMVNNNMKSNAVAAAAGITQSDFSLIRRGKRNCFLFTIGKIAKGLGVELEDITTNDNASQVAAPATPSPVEPPPLADPPKPKRKAKPREPPPAWVTDYEAYKKEGWGAILALTKDANWMQKMEEYHPRLNILKSIEKSWNTYWGTEEGWEKKKKVKVRTINWKSTIGRTLQFSGVYKTQDWRQ